MNAKKTWLIVIAIITWFALSLQLYLMLTSTFSAGFSTINTIINFFSYFTILGNLFVAITVSVSLANPSPGNFFLTVWYPYPFLHAGHFGYGKVAVNSLFVLAAFVVFGLVIVRINRSARKAVARS